MMIDYAINNILVPLDFSAASLNALHTAIEMARRHSAGIMILNILEPGLANSQQKTNDNEEEKSIHAQRVKQLYPLVKTVMQKHGITCNKSIVKGKVTDAISRAAIRFKADIIVMGTHGMSGYNPSAIGSNTARLMDQTGCPVLTVPPQQKWLTFKEILFPIWPPMKAVERYGYVKNIVKKNESILKILGLSTDFENNISSLKLMASQLKEHVSIDKVKTASYFKIGKNMAGEVLKISALLKTDLIVIAATMDATFTHLFNSTYTRQIINRSKVPVLCVRER